MKILVLGGTRYFGKRLVEDLLQQGHDVFVLARGLTGMTPSAGAKFLKGDRGDETSLRQAVEGLSFDAVVDQICMTAGEAEIAVRVFADKTKYYAVTSTLSVYGLGAGHREEDVQPLSYEPRESKTPAELYGEGKRAMEQVFASQKFFPVGMLRIPVVVGEDDYTERLKNLVRNVYQKNSIYFPNLEAEFSFIYAADAAKALRWFVDHSFEGPLNVASREVIQLKDLVSRVERVCGQSARLVDQPAGAWVSPYGVTSSWTLNVARSEKLGLVCQPLDQYLEDLLKYHLEEILKES